MTLRVLSVETMGRSPRARRLVLSDGTERTTSQSVVRKLELHEGTGVGDQASFSAALDTFERSCARERSFRALAHRDYSAAELAQRLIDDGYPAVIAEETVESLVRSGLVNDERFAEVWACSRARQGLGRRRIAEELARKGIDDELARSALASIPEDEVTRARSALRGPLPEDRKARDRALRRLVGRGFDLPVALRALDAECEGEMPAQEGSDPFQHSP